MVQEGGVSDTCGTFNERIGSLHWDGVQNVEGGG